MPRRQRETDGVVVGAVAARGPAQRGGLRPGGRVVALNGQPVRDVIAFHFNAGEARLTCAVERDGGPASVVVERRGADLGLGLLAPAPSGGPSRADKGGVCLR